MNWNGRKRDYLLGLNCLYHLLGGDREREGREKRKKERRGSWRL